jgi:sodium transport system permease protein
MMTAVLRKELTDHSRDRRTLLSGLLLPVLGPLLVLGMFTRIASWAREDQPLVIPVIGAENAPHLIAFLQRGGAVIEAAPADYEAQVRDGKLDLALSIPEDYGKEFEAGRGAPLQLAFDSSNNKTQRQTSRVRHLLEAYTHRLSALRMIARGVSPSLVAPLDVTEADLATPERTAANVLSVIPLFLLMAAFVGGLHLAIDCSAGERERGSLEPLLVNPVSRAAVVTGKWLAVVAVTSAAICVALFGFMLAVRHVPLQDLGIRFQMGSREIVGLLAACLPLAFFAGALQITLALFARTFKEAQTYLSILMMVPIVPATFLSLSPIKTQLWMMAVPILGQTVLMGDVLRGEGRPLYWFAIAAACALLGAALFLTWATKLLKSEKIIFGRAS